MSLAVTIIYKDTRTGFLKEGMMEIALFILMLIALAIAANRWGINSIDGPDSPEWERRRRWYGFH